MLEWGKHTLDGCSLTVSQNIQPARPKKAMSLKEQEPESERSRVIRVTGISPKTTKDELLNFFENTRRSGGGEIEEIQNDPDEMIAEITFCSAEGKSTYLSFVTVIVSYVLLFYIFKKKIKTIKFNVCPLDVFSC